MRFLELGTEVEDALAPYAAVDRTPAEGRCWVTAHMVAGLDGCAAVGGRVGALSTAPDKALFADMRTLADVVLVGARTVREEGYGPIRLSEERSATRVARGLTPAPPLAVVSRSLDLDWDSRAFADAAPESRTIVVTCADAPAPRLARAREVAEVLVAGEESVQPDDLFRQLAARGQQRVLCEGGPSLLGELVVAGHVDELCLTISPMMGGDPLPVAVFPPGAPLTGFSLRHVLGEDDTLFLRYEVDRDD
ncbi:pyrimidine reductase family protein [Marmoricola sp. URHB0036]|uniref:pyrimidine reductase family protein n=1 Tax=Marmoricola sp. URHB0036 TaxID=1298863 RepID=UPI0004039C09|nr:pyrimidine reductase family protein [Marmoricola sp. URHB0036]